MLIVGLAFIGFSVHEYGLRHRLDGRGLPARAVVTDWYKHKGAVRIRVRYDAGRGPVSATIPVSQTFGDNTGETVDVVYDPAHPSTARLAGQVRHPVGWLEALFFGVGLLMIGAAVVPLLLRRR
jgi:hypothetical protein